jgi:hypothetical protein
MSTMIVRLRDRNVKPANAWHFPHTAARHSRENDPKPHNAGNHRGKTTPHRQQSKLLAQHFDVRRSASVSLLQRRSCDEYFKRNTDRRIMHAPMCTARVIISNMFQPFRP